MTRTNLDAVKVRAQQYADTETGTFTLAQWVPIVQGTAWDVPALIEHIQFLETELEDTESALSDQIRINTKMEAQIQELMILASLWVPMNFRKGTVLDEFE